MPNTTQLHLAILFARLVLGFYFVYAGFAKVRGELTQGFGSFYNSAFYQSMQPGWMPDVFAAVYGYALPWVELTIGLLLMLGLFGTIAAVLVALTLISIIFALLGAGQLFAFQSAYDSPGPYHANLVFFALALLLTIGGPGRYSVDQHWRRKKST